MSVRRFILHGTLAGLIGASVSQWAAADTLSLVTTPTLSTTLTVTTVEQGTRVTPLPVFANLLLAVDIDDSACPGASKAIKDYFHLWLAIDFVEEERMARVLAMWVLGTGLLLEPITREEVRVRTRELEDAMGMDLSEAAQALSDVTAGCVIPDLQWLLNYYRQMRKTYGKELYNEARMRRMLKDYDQRVG